MYIGDVEVTKREVATSFAIVFIMLFMGFFISNKISDYSDEQNEVYYQAVKINADQNQFKYGMKTSIGNALVYGEMKAVDAVSMPELVGNYLAIEKDTERYTRHTRTVKSGKTYHTEVYYTWDTIDTDEKVSKNVTYLGITFPENRFSFDRWVHIDLSKQTVDSKHQSWIFGNCLYNNGDKWANVGDLRYSYRAIASHFKGTALGKLDSNDFKPIDGNKIAFLSDKTIDSVISDKENSHPTTVFWVFWIIFVIVAVVVFVCLRNKWLED